MKRHQSKERRKQKRKRQADRKAKQEQRLVVEEQDKLLDMIAEQPLVTEISLPDAPSMSPARRAFQDG